MTVRRPATPAPGALPSAVAGLAVALAATSLVGVLTGSGWWGLAVVTIAVVVAAGVLLRWVGLPPFAVAAGQLATLVGLVTALFTRSGVLIVVPGPDALRQLRSVLDRAVQQVQVGVPPVPASTELLCLVVLGLGLIAIAVDTVVVSAAAPAAAGLLLLCVIAVPTSLADQLLPWWSFLFGALGFALLLTVNAARRSVTWDERADSARHTGTAVAMGAGAIVVALLIGSTFTAVGTDGRLLGGMSGDGSRTTGIGLNPFTSLRGQLDAGETVELFRVRGLAQRSYLRALTLSRFAAGQGWQLSPLDAMTQANGGPTGNSLPLPNGVSDPVAGSAVQVEIEPIDYVDHWLPSFGYPRQLRGIGPEWRYDPNAITVFSDRRQRAEPYTELGVLPAPDPEQLRAAGPSGGKPLTAIDQQFLDTSGVDPRVTELAARLTAGTPTAFDATLTINRWFTEPSNGFRYDVRTAPGGTGDALVEFLFTGRTGYCEQFASAMAIMLRTVGVPARVAVGFTSGTSSGDTRLITTADAHAWVEAWFPGVGWLPFDPTPLADGRTIVPSYVAATAPAPGSPPLPTEQQAPPPVPPTLEPASGMALERGANDDSAGLGGPAKLGLGAGALLMLAVAAGLTPLIMRECQRRRRLRLVQTGGPKAVSAAWEEVLAESADRGGQVPGGETVRGAAHRLTIDYGLDAAGKAALHILADAVERSWYGGDTAPNTAQDFSGQNISGALDTVRSSLARCAPKATAARLLPRSVLRQQR